jgi:hypothetical protein
VAYNMSSDIDVQWDAQSVAGIVAELSLLVTFDQGVTLETLEVRSSMGLIYITWCEPPSPVCKFRVVIYHLLSLDLLS